MRVRGLRVGTRFVLEDRGGLWEKISDTRARCVFGNREEYGKEFDVNPDAFAFGWFDGQRRERPELKIIMVEDGTDAILAEYTDVSQAVVAAVTATEIIRVRLPRGRKKRQYMVMETCIDLEESVLYVGVREDKPVGVPGDEDDAKEVTSKAQSVPSQPQETPSTSKDVQDSGNRDAIQGQEEGYSV